jgi:hypothetical protein
MSSDTRTLNPEVLRRLRDLWRPWGTQQRFAARVAAVANKSSAPSQQQVATQAQILGRVLRTGRSHEPIFVLIAEPWTKARTSWTRFSLLHDPNGL